MTDIAPVDIAASEPAENHTQTAATDAYLTHIIRHPGPAATDRIQILRTGLVPLEGTLKVGEDLTSGLHRIFADAGCRGGVAMLKGGACAPFQFVGPSFPTDDTHAAWYSETRIPEAGARIVGATAIIGWRDGEAFVHCHGHWQTQDHLPSMGHVLTSECRVAEPIAISGFGSPTAWFESLPDAETNFTLYTPAGSAHADESLGAGMLLRIRPHQDLCHAIETACREQGITQARIFGLGSVISPDFEDAPRITCPITEIVLEQGVLVDGMAHIHMRAVDVHGTMRSGKIRRGGNPVCVTAELLVLTQPA
ncbi:PCC domain-containing protein [Pararhodobacter sp.]|uniref:PCC domain-containing protein n=1 Tax=Pararhodobacter sp. TaxID=2127056 RepID=UPI002AFFA642|nr:DUF296 domain-containing protein [Pararhodobacter sp.]